MSSQFAYINKYLNVETNELFTEQQYSIAVANLVEYNKLFRNSDKASDEYVYTLDETDRKNLIKLFGAVKKFVTQIVCDNTGRYGDSEKDIIVNLSLMWPLSYSIVISDDFQPYAWFAELYPIIAHSDVVEDEIKKRNRSIIGLSSKLKNMNNLLTKINTASSSESVSIKSLSNTNKDIIQLLNIQTELIKHLSIQRF